MRGIIGAGVSLGLQGGRAAGLLLAFQNGDGEVETAARAGGAFQPHAAAVQLDETAADRQAQARAFAAAPTFLAHLAEFVEYFGGLFGRDARAAVFNADLQHILRLAEMDGHAALVGEAQAVIEQVQ